MFGCAMFGLFIEKARFKRDAVLDRPRNRLKAGGVLILLRAGRDDR